MSEKRMPARLKGSFTVEASILIGLTMFFLAALLLAVFFLHDRAVLQANSCEAVSAAVCTLNASEGEAAAQEIKKMISEKRLLGTRGLSGSVNVQKTEAKAEWSGSYPVSGMVAPFFQGNQIPVKASWSSEYPQPADWIRKIRGIKKLINGE